MYQISFLFQFTVNVEMTQLRTYILEFLSQCIIIAHLLACLIKIEFSEGKVWSSIFAFPASGQEYACMLSCFSCVRLFATLWTVACQALLFLGFSRQEWVAIPSSRGSSWPRDQIKPVSCATLALHTDCLLQSHQGSLVKNILGAKYSIYKNVKQFNKSRFFYQSIGFFFPLLNPKPQK